MQGVTTVVLKSVHIILYIQYTHTYIHTYIHIVQVHGGSISSPYAHLGWYSAGILHRPVYYSHNHSYNHSYYHVYDPMSTHLECSSAGLFTDDVVTRHHVHNHWRSGDTFSNNLFA